MYIYIYTHISVYQTVTWISYPDLTIINEKHLEKISIDMIHITREFPEANQWLYL